MRAKRINEDIQNILSPKNKMEAVDQYIYNKIWDDMMGQIQEMVDKIYHQGISLQQNEKFLLDTFKEHFDGAVTYAIETYMTDDIDEGTKEDIFKPRSKEDIFADLVDIYGEKELYDLRDGTRAWVVEEYIKDMAGEMTEALSIIDEFGNKEFLNNENLSRFEMEDRRHLVKLLDDMRERNESNSGGWAK